MRATLYSTRRRLTTVCESHGRPASPRTQSGHPSRRRGALRIRAMFGSPDFSETAPVPDAIPATAVDSDWRSFRAKLVARYPEQHNALEWAHPLPSPELGCILVAHPLMFAQQQTYFNLAVIFVFVHDHFGTAGLILNKPTRYSLGDLDLMKNAANGFEDNTLYMGGDVGDDALNLLHPFKDIKDSVPVIDGVYLNGFEEAQKSILKGKRRPSDFKWYARYCGWHPGQLEEECKSGVWFPAACSSDLIVKDLSMAQGPADLWHQVMQLMGGEYKELSDVIIESYSTTDRNTR